jgi:hypothetical protein
MKRIAVTLALLLVANAAAASIRGTVVGGGRAVANAKISAYALESAKETITRAVANLPRLALATTTSAADGAFTLPIDGAGCVAVYVDAATFAPSFTEAALGDGDVLISLAPKRSAEITLRSPAGPLAGARVVVFAQDVLVETAADDRGKLALHDFGDATMLVLHPSIALRIVDVPHRDGVVDVEAGVPLKGTVIDARGTGVPDARILIDSVPVATSAADGSFTIERAPRHYGVLSAEAGDLGGEIRQTSPRAVIRVTPRPSVSGVIRDAEGRPLRGIALALASGRHDDVAVTDGSGKFAVRVAPGRYEASSASASYRLGDAKLHVWKPLVKDFVAKRAPILAGIVRRADGSPVAGAQVIVATEGGKSETPVGTLTTGPDGRFRIVAPLLASSLRVVAYKRGFSPSESRKVDPNMAARDLSIVLSKGEEVGGIVRDTAGHPLAGVAVTMQRIGRDLLADVADPPLTDSEGRFSTRVTAETWRATFSKEGYLTREITNLTLTATTKPLLATLEPAAAIRGRIVRSDGSGIESARVTAEDMPGQTITAADGSFTLAPVRAGANVVTCKTPGGATGEANVTAPASDVRVVVDGTGVLRGRVVDKGGAPVPMFEVLVSPFSSGNEGLAQFADADGRFTLNDVPAGEMEVTVSADGFFKTLKHGVEVEAGKATEEMTFTLSRGRTAHGRVVSSGGEPLGEVMIGDARESKLWTETDEWYEEPAKTNADGTYEIGDLPIDRLPLEFEKEGFGPVVRELPPGDGDVTIDVTLSPALVLTGRVVGPDGQPVPRARVFAYSAAATATFPLAETDGQGAFRLRGLVPAHYDLFATTASDIDAVPAEGEESLDGKLLDVDVERVHDVTIRTSPGLFGAISGEMTGGEPRATVSIHVSTRNGLITREAGQGHYRLPKIPIGMDTVRATLLSENRWTRPVVVEVVANGEARADLHLPESFPIDGRVLRDGLPSSGERIDFTDDSGEQVHASTAEDGTYSTNLVAGRYRIAVGSYSIERDIAGPGTVDIEVDLARVVVTIVDAVTEAPIEDATVSSLDAGYLGHRARTSSKGQVKLDLPRSVNEIVVEKEGYGTATAAPSSPVLVKLTRSKEVAVHIVDARDGRPLSGDLGVRDADGHVLLQSGEGSINGTRYAALNPGRYRFSAWTGGYGSHTVTADVPPFDVQVPLSREGRLLLQSQTGLRGTAHLIQPDGEPYVRDWNFVDTAIEGRSTLVEGIAPGNYTLEVRLAGKSPRRIPVRVVEGETATVPIDP